MEWKFPIDLPRFTDEDMKAKKAEYVAEHGYYISPPKLSDIIHIRVHKDPDDEEFERYKKARRLYFLINKYPESRAVPKWKEERDEWMTASRYYDISFARPDLAPKRMERHDVYGRCQ